MHNTVFQFHKVQYNLLHYNGSVAHTVHQNTLQLSTLQYSTLQHIEL